MNTKTPEPADHGGNIISIARRTGRDVSDFLDFSSNINEFIDTEKFEYSKIVQEGERSDYYRYYPETDYRDIEMKFAVIEMETM